MKKPNSSRSRSRTSVPHVDTTSLLGEQLSRYRGTVYSGGRAPWALESGPAKVQNSTRHWSGPWARLMVSKDRRERGGVSSQPGRGTLRSTVVTYFCLAPCTLHAHDATKQKLQQSCEPRRHRIYTYNFHYPLLLPSTHFPAMVGFHYPAIAFLQAAQYR